jgi:hypothetical protein
MNTIFGIIASIIGIFVILFVIWFCFKFYEESKINEFRKRMFIGNKYISKKLSVSTLNPYHDYEPVNLLGWKTNIGGVIYVRYSVGSCEYSGEYSASIYDFMNEYRIYKYADQANSEYKKEIHQTN